MIGTGAPRARRPAGAAAAATAMVMVMVMTAAVLPGACRRPGGPGPEPAPAPALPALAFAEPVVELRAEVGERRTREVRLAGAAAARARLTLETVEDPALEVRILPAGAGLPAGLALAFTGDRAGTRAGQVVVATGIPEPARLTLLYALRVPSHIRIVPSNPYFNLRDPGARARVLRVQGARADFRVLEATVVDGPFRATLRPGAPGAEASVEVAVEPAAVTTGQRGILGKLRLRTSDPAEPDLEVPLFAMGALPPPGIDAAPDARAP